LSRIEELKDVPAVSLIDESPEQLLNRLRADYETKMTALTDTAYTVQPGEPVELILKAMTQQFFQLEALIDRGAKMSFAAYSYGDWLDNLAANKAVFRKPALTATTVLRFTASSTEVGVIPIFAGTRVRDENNSTFATDQYAQMQPGELFVDVHATAIEPGIAANGIAPGGVNTFIDRPAFVQSVENIETTGGGDDIESDEQLTYRYLLEWARHNTAGARQAYEYWVRQFRADIGTVEVYRNAPGEVTILCLMEDGSTPEQPFLDDLLAFLSEEDKRPLGDDIHVGVPGTVAYTIAFSYWIGIKDAPRAGKIQENIAAAVQKYIEWQRVIGRNLSPNKLTQMLIDAGALRVAITNPTFSVIAHNQIAKLNGSPGIAYNGTEEE
jgi:phage-related baseplate assembly protein